MKPSSGFGSWGEAKPEVVHMIGAGFRHRFSESRVQNCKPFGSCRPACWETNGSCEELAAEPGRGEITREKI